MGFAENVGAFLNNQCVLLQLDRLILQIVFNIKGKS